MRTRSATVQAIAFFLLLTVPPFGQANAERDPVFDYFGGLEFERSIPRPADIIGHEIGERFTRQDRVLAYLETLAKVSDRVTYDEYGRTHQQRVLSYVVISSPDNLNRLDEILAANAELADPRNTSASRADEIARDNPAIVWFSYNVHGNEPSPSEAAMQVAYTLAAGVNAEIRDILNDVVLVIDPMLNPDGHERYVSFIDNATGAKPNADPVAAEHDEPWPGGRSNHYMFDLNRDWVWLVQPESQARLPVYRRFRPQLHIDYHEQGYRSPYFFGAGDTPYNRNIPGETIEWLDVYGEDNAEVFDARGLLYSTRERFDYLYPGYGKVLPVYHGAVGLLCEQAGHSRAGLAIKVDDSYTLTLRERAHHHFLTGMSYLETTARLKQEQIKRFADFFRSSMELRDGVPAAFVVSAANDPGLLSKLWDLCDGQGIEVERLRDSLPLDGLHEYRHGEVVEEGQAPAGSWVIRSTQPMGRLAAALMERSTFVEDPDTYDMTSWSLPVMFGLDAWYSDSPLGVRTERITEWTQPRGRVLGGGNVAVLVDSRQSRFGVAMGIAAELELSCRVAGEPFTIEGRSFGISSLIVHTGRNNSAAIESFIERVCDAGTDVVRVGTGLTEAGPVLGANANAKAELPNVLLLRGDSFSSLSYGHHWHLLDIESPLPYTAVNAGSVGSIDLDDFSVVVAPSGGMSSGLGGRGVDALRTWIRDGGTLVASGSSAYWASSALLEIEEEEEESEDERPPLNELSWEERQDRSVEDRVPGAILRASVDGSHPLSAGVREWIGVLKFGARALPVGESGQVVVRFDEDMLIGGVIADRYIESLTGEPWMTVHRMGRGRVICLSDDPTNRGFHHASMRLLLNAIVIGPSL